MTLVSIVATPSFALAESVGQKEASHLAWTFFNAAHSEVTAKPKLVYNGRQLTTDRLFSPFYVYNLPGKGFVIIAADNKAFPILGYNLDDNFNPNHIEPAMLSDLKGLARDIELIRYDSRVPHEAISSWNDYRGYVASLLTSGKSSAMRKNASEFDLRQEGNIDTASKTKAENKDEDEPFSFHDNFVARNTLEAKQRELLLQEKLSPSIPIITAIGGGHYQIRLPENVSMTRIFNMQGATVDVRTFRNTDTAIINLDKFPEGFYLALVIGDSGKPYGFKLHK